jgi:hypothetical protein
MENERAWLSSSSLPKLASPSLNKIKTSFICYTFLISCFLLFSLAHAPDEPLFLLWELGAPVKLDHGVIVFRVPHAGHAQVHSRPVPCIILAKRCTGY